jgi:hypothetical protein
MLKALASIFLIAAHLHLNGPLVDAHHSVSVRPSSISLVSQSGAVRWRWRTPRGSSRTWFLAAGDLNGDRVPEVVVASYWPLGSVCGSTPRSSSAIYVLDGRTGKAARFGPRLADSCFHFGSLVYPIDQWLPGSISIDHGTLAAFPVYATEAWVRHAGVVQRLVFPSTPEYDKVFPGCHHVPGAGQCYLPYSHNANVVFVPGGLFVLTSERALTYGGGKPVDDLTWTSGTTPNAGRNKGFVFTFVDHGHRYAELVGGCTVANEQRAIRLHVLPTGIIGNCAIHHHFEWFELRGLRIAKHANHYYGYIGTDGYLRSRLEAPAPANGPLGGRGTHWTVFNRFDGTDWTLEVLPDPARPDQIREYARTYAWGMADLTGDGRAELLVTRGGGYFLPWRFDVLTWQSGGWQRLAHIPGLLPALLQYPDLPSEHFSDGHSAALPGKGGDSRYGLRTSGRRVLVEALRGRRFWLRLDR